MPQTTVQYRQDKWLCEGQYASTAQRRIDGAIQFAKNGNALLPFGRVATLDPATNIAAPLSGAPGGSLLLIIPIFTERFGLTLSSLISNDSSSFGYPANYENVEYITMGDVVMYSEQAVNVGDPVFYRHTAAAAPNNVVGRVRKAAVTSETPASALTTARFAETTTAAGLVLVRVQTLVSL